MRLQKKKTKKKNKKKTRNYWGVGGGGVVLVFGPPTLARSSDTLLFGLRARFLAHNGIILEKVIKIKSKIKQT